MVSIAFTSIRICDSVNAVIGSLILPRSLSAWWMRLVRSRTLSLMRGLAMEFRSLPVPWLARSGAIKAPSGAVGNAERPGTPGGRVPGRGFPYRDRILACTLIRTSFQYAFLSVVGLKV